MKLSKTKFSNYIRCNRFVALEEIYYEKDDAIVSFSEDVELEDLMSIENFEKRKMLLSDMFDEQTKEDLLKKENEQHEMMLPYYNKLEILSGRAIHNRFGGETIYDLNTFNQKSFSYHKDGFDFYCFLDGYQEDLETIRILETKATTSNKFSVENFNYRKKDDKKKYPMFTKLSTGIFVPTEDIDDNLPKSYYTKEKKLLNRQDELGRYIYDLAYQRYVYEKSNKSSKNIEYYLIILNHEYTYDGKTNPDGTSYYDDNLVRFYNLTSLTNKLMAQIEDDSNLIIKRLNNMDARKVDIGTHCNRGKTNECIFYDVCHKDLPAINSLFTYTYGHHGFKEPSGKKYERFDLINSGMYKATDIPIKWLNRPNNVIQRQVIDTGIPYYNKQKIRDGIKQLKYPIYHLDFESFNSPIPRFKGESPYTQSLFQFSIHIERSPGICDIHKDHYHFLAKDNTDLRRELTEKMINIIKDDNGSVLVYNSSFEKTRIKELQIYFPEYFEPLQRINERIFDLMDIVQNNTKLYLELGYEEHEAKEYNFYHNDLNGSYSLKKVLPIFSELSYEGMRVGNGTEAMVAYSKLDTLKGKEYEETYIDLVNYCKQDTWAMYEILKTLREI